jgi:atlastin
VFNIYSTFLINSGNSDNEGEFSGKLLGNRPIPIVVATEQHAFELDEEALADVLLDDDIKDKKVAVISVAGAFRKGKSFLLDFFLRYLDRKVRAGFFFCLNSFFLL